MNCCKFCCNVNLRRHTEAWAARHDPNVLLVFYEDLKDDADAQAGRLLGTSTSSSTSTSSRLTLNLLLLLHWCVRAFHTHDKQCSYLGRVLVLNDPPGRCGAWRVTWA